MQTHLPWSVDTLYAYCANVNTNVRYSASLLLNYSTPTMVILFRILFLTLVLYIQKSDADCTDFRKQCTEFCLGRSGGVENNQCWGSPKYRYCICSDNYIYFVPGYTCEHPTCPTAVVEDGTLTIWFTRAYKA